MRRALLLTALGMLAGCAYEATAARQPLHGDKLFDRRCGACHEIDADSIGPRLGGVVGRRAGMVQDYHYSKALAQANLVWTPATLEAWLSDPQKVVPGARMRFHLDDRGERQELIAYLQSHNQ